MKRVYTLYRVSTAQQVDIVKDDIPMQRIACHEFAKRQGDWVIVKEFEEKGMQITYLTEQQKAAFAEAIAQWKQTMIDQFGEYACGCFGITK